MLNYVYPLCINNNTRKIDVPYVQRENMSLICKDDAYNSYTTVYTLSPEITPLPYNTEFYCFEYDDFYPYNITKFSILRDPFMKTENCVIFIAWRIQVKNTVPLYIYKTGEGIKVSLKKIDTDYINLRDTTSLYILKKYPPIFVMDKYIDKFVCEGNTNGISPEENNTCIPSNTGTDIMSCIISCCVECDKNKDKNNIKNSTLNKQASPVQRRQNLFYSEKINTNLYLYILLFLCMYILIFMI